MQMLNLEKEERGGRGKRREGEEEGGGRGGRGKRREEGDSCHVITIFRQLYTIVSSLISLLELLLWFEVWEKHSEIFSPQFR